MKSRCFLFIFIILVFILDFRLVRKLVFLYFNVNVYLKEIPCLNKVTLPYLTLPVRRELKKDAQRSVFDEIRGVSSGDETLCRMLDVTSQTK